MSYISIISLTVFFVNTLHVHVNGKYSVMVSGIIILYIPAEAMMAERVALAG